jgi:hypothetical protein
MSERFGPRIAPGGYQGPSTHAVALERGAPIQEKTWTIGTARITLKVVPMKHGRPELYELEYMLDDPAARMTIYTPCMVRGAELARIAFELTATELDAGRIPDVVLLAPGTPLGP